MYPGSCAIRSKNSDAARSPHRGCGYGVDPVLVEAGGAIEGRVAGEKAGSYTNTAGDLHSRRISVLDRYG
jgi:hypothetical protein